MSTTSKAADNVSVEISGHHRTCEVQNRQLHRRQSPRLRRRLLIAEVNGSTEHIEVRGLDEETTEANAWLVAAASDLLAVSQDRCDSPLHVYRWNKLSLEQQGEGTLRTPNRGAGDGFMVNRLSLDGRVHSISAPSTPPSGFGD